MAPRNALLKSLAVIGLIGCGLCAGPSRAADPQAADPRATALLHQALAAQGGEAALRGLTSIAWDAYGYRNELEESERPEGPYITDFLHLTEVHDLKGHRYRSTSEAKVYPVYQTSSATVVDGDVAMVSSDGRNAPGTPQQVQIARERLALSPERLLLTALDAPDVRRAPDAVLQSVPQNVIAFSLDGAPALIYLNAYTHLPTAVDYSGPLARSGFAAYLGDVTQRTYYGLWWLAKGGLHFPLQWNVEIDGRLDRLVVIRDLKIDGPLDGDALAIPADIRARFRPDAPARDLETLALGDPRSPPVELAPGMVLIPGSWNVTLIRQADGVVVLEAPISSGYSAAVIAESRRRFPGLAIKAVVTTSDSWPHNAGLREYVAEGVPVYALDLNRPILARLVAAERHVRPDALARAPRAPRFHLVSVRTVLGAGPNRLELIPIRGETSERQMMAYFPEHRLLYGSDPFQRNGDGSYFYPQTVSELTAAAEREHLDVARFFMMHVGPTPWAELDKALRAARESDSPHPDF